MSADKQQAFAELLPNLDPKAQQFLAIIGITSVRQLNTLGSIAVYAKAKRANIKVSLNLLWALEAAALVGIHWQEIARNHRTVLLMALDEYEEQC